jgi:hypothetical protein
MLDQREFKVAVKVKLRIWLKVKLDQQFTESVLYSRCKTLFRLSSKLRPQASPHNHFAEIIRL